MAEKEEQAHSMGISLRLDPSTLKTLKEDSEGTTLSVVLGASVNRTLRKLAIKAEEGE
jgi:hypothetical protein